MLLLVEFLADDWIKYIVKRDPNEPLLIRLPLDKMAAISQTIFSDAFSWMKRTFCMLIKISLKFVPKVLRV